MNFSGISVQYVPNHLDICTVSNNLKVYVSSFHVIGNNYYKKVGVGCRVDLAMIDTPALIVWPLSGAASTVLVIVIFDYTVDFGTSFNVSAPREGIIGTLPLLYLLWNLA